MSPIQTFRLDIQGYTQCAGLLAKAGMQFIQDQALISDTLQLPLERVIPTIASVTGQLLTPHGAFPCQLSRCEGKYSFRVTLLGAEATAISLFDDLESAFAGHLIK